MKTNNIKQWITLLLTVSGMAMLPLTVSANKSVLDGSTVTESGTAYDDAGGNALNIRNNSTYNGTNITLTSAGVQYGVYVSTGGTVNLTNATVTVTVGAAGGGRAMYATGTGSTIKADGIDIIQNSSAAAVFTDPGATLELNNFTITSTTSNGGSHLIRLNGTGFLITNGTLTGNSALMSFYAGSTGTINNISGTTTGLGLLVSGSSVVSGSGLHLSSDGMTVRVGEESVLDLADSTFISSNTITNAVLAVPNSSVVTGRNLTVIATGEKGGLAIGALVSATVILNDSHIVTTGSNGGAYWADIGGVIIANNNTVEVTDGVAIYALQNPRYPTTTISGTVIINGGTINVANGNLVQSDGEPLTVIMNGAEVSYTGDLLHVSSTVDYVNNPANGDVRLTVNDMTTTGDINVAGNAVAEVNLNNSTAAGNLIVSDDAALTVTLNDSVITGKSSVSDSGIINLSLTNGANWNLTGKSKLTTLSSSGGSITINNVEGDDLTVSGGISGQTALHLTLSDGIKDQTEIRVVVDKINAMSASAFVLGSEISNGMYDYALENKTDGAWLIYTDNGGSNPPTISSEGDVIINTAAAVSGFWFTQLDNLHKRMGELRYNRSSSTTTLTGKDDKSVTLSGEQLLENIWIRAYGQQINANTGIRSVNGFGETQYGVDLGTDHLWNLDADNQLYTGIFAGYGGADREFHTATHYNGSTDSGYGGLYATWLNVSGWYADFVAKGQYFRNDFSGADSGKYDSVGAGVSIEFGRQFEFQDGWFAEPSVQMSYLHLMNDNYTTRDGMNVTLSDADVLHFYGGARLGRNIKLTNSGFLQPYIKVGGLEQISSGNKLTVSGDHWRPNLDGARAIIGAGIVWQLDADNQLHLDYEASFGDKYDKPWGLNFGYRHQF